jgi:hypothetical protein
MVAILKNGSKKFTLPGFNIFVVVFKMLKTGYDV